jgi:8-oxo-dGTP pyrophosphatase MutT (NUDIX family)
MHAVKSCGILVLRREPELGFLLLRHSHRFDLPKGHLEEGESEIACALRELTEETGLAPADVRVEEGFRFSTTYYPRYRRLGGVVVEKTAVIFLAWLVADRPITLTEHEGYEWVPWRPPHRIDPRTVDQVLAAVEQFLSGRP